MAAAGGAAAGGAAAGQGGGGCHQGLGRRPRTEESLNCS